MKGRNIRNKVSRNVKKVAAEKEEISWEGTL